MNNHQARTDHAHEEEDEAMTDSRSSRSTWDNTVKQQTDFQKGILDSRKAERGQK